MDVYEGDEGMGQGNGGIVVEMGRNKGDYLKFMDLYMQTSEILHS